MCFFQLVFRCYGHDLIILESCIQHENSFTVRLILFVKHPVASFCPVDRRNKCLRYIFLQFNAVLVKGNLK